MPQPDKRTVKVGVVGCGVVATTYYLPYLMKMEDAELIAVCDLDTERTAAGVRLFGAKEPYQDYAEMIDRADIEAVFILTGPGTHVPFTLKAVERGKHVLLQKPMTLTPDDASAMVEAVRRAGVKALIEPSSSTLLDPDYVTLRGLIDKGVLGDPWWDPENGGGFFNAKMHFFGTSQRTVPTCPVNQEPCRIVSWTSYTNFEEGI